MSTGSIELHGDSSTPTSVGEQEPQQPTSMEEDGGVFWSGPAAAENSSDDEAPKSGKGTEAAGSSSEVNAVRCSTEVEALTVNLAGQPSYGHTAT